MLLWAASFGSAAPGEGQSDEDLLAGIRLSTVIIREGTKHTGGIVLDAAGLILCDYRSVVSPFPKTIIVHVPDGDGYATREYNDFAVVGVHPRVELALLRIKGLKERLKPIPRSSRAFSPRAIRKRPPVKIIGVITGTLKPVVAGPVASKLDHQATRGGQQIVLLDPSVGTMMLGGAVLDAAGLAIGIMTSTRAGFESQQMMPLRSVRPASFVHPNRRPKMKVRDPWLGPLWLRVRRSLCSGPKDPERLFAAAHRLATARDTAEARRFHAAGAKLAPKSRRAYHILGVIELTEQSGDHLKTWMKGFEIAGIDTSIDMWANLIYGLEQAKRYAEAAYLLHWTAPRNEVRRKRGERLVTPVRTSRHGRRLLGLYRHLHPEQADLLDRKTTPHSWTQLDAFALIGQRPEAKSGAAYLAALMATTADPGEKGITLALPDRVTDACLAWHGRRLVLRYAKLRRLDVLDLPACKLVGGIRTLEDDTPFAAGGRRVVTYSRQYDVLEQWDAESLKKVKASPLRYDHLVNHIAMGVDADDRALVLMDGRSPVRGYYGVLNLPAGEITGLWRANRPKPVGLGIDAAGTFFIVNNWPPRPPGPVTMTFVWMNDQGFAKRRNPRGTALIEGVLSLDGHRIYARDRIIELPATTRRNGETRLIKEYPGSVVLPALGTPDVYVEIDAGSTLRLRETGNHSVLRRLKLPFKLRLTNMAPKTPVLIASKQVWAVGRANRLVLIDPDKPR
ncbi:hypothetical protein LCGC14_1791630, partial [marine sediment metagenome]